MRTTEMFKRKLSLPLWLIVLLLAIAILASVVTGVLIIQRSIDLQFKVETDLEMQLYDTDGTTVLTVVDMGNFAKKEVKRFPAGNDTYYFIKNTGYGDLWIAYGVGTLPDGCTLRVYLNENELKPEYELTPGVMYGSVMTSSETWRFYFSLHVAESAPSGTYTVELNWYAYSTSQG